MPSDCPTVESSGGGTDPRSARGWGERTAIGMRWGGGEDAREGTVEGGRVGRAEVGADDDGEDEGSVAGSVSDDVPSEAAAEREVQSSDRARDDDDRLTRTRATASATSRTRSR